MLKLIVGLGNLGPQYSLNRHNVGFMFVDVLAEMYQATPFKRHGQTLLTDININQHKVMLAKPMTYMNLSGHAVSPLVQFFKIPLDEIMVIHDDLDLIFNKIRFKQGGGHGGHNGLKNLDSTIGNNYWRLRFGIDHPGHKDAVTGYVLGNFSKDEQDQLVITLAHMAQAASQLITLDTDAFLKNVNSGS